MQNPHRLLRLLKQWDLSWFTHAQFSTHTGEEWLQLQKPMKFAISANLFQAGDTPKEALTLITPWPRNIIIRLYNRN